MFVTPFLASKRVKKGGVLETRFFIIILHLQVKNRRNFTYDNFPFSASFLFKVVKDEILNASGRV